MSERKLRRMSRTELIDVIDTLRQDETPQDTEALRRVDAERERLPERRRCRRVLRGTVSAQIVEAAIAVLLATLALILGALYTYYSDVQAEQLRLQTALVAHALETEGVSYFDDLDTSDRRITWIAADGTVLYDSRSDSGVMENHLEREEVKAALATGSGTCFRYSDTLMERYFYTAQRLSDGTVLRLSAAQNTVPHLVLGVVKPIILVIGIAVALSALLAGQPGLQLLDGIFQGRVVVVAVLELKLLRLQHFRAQPRPDELFRRHAMVGDKAQHGKGGRPQNAHPGQGFHPKIGAQYKVKAHGHAAGENRKNELPHRQPKKHTLRVITDFSIDLNFQNVYLLAYF